MKPSELLRLVWNNITQNKFKTIMTSIGIIVGAATIVMVIAIGKGGQEDVADQFKNLNAGAIDISYDGGDKNRGGNQSSDDSSDSGMMMMPSGSGAPSGSSSSGGVRGFRWTFGRIYGRWRLFRRWTVGWPRRWKWWCRRRHAG